MKLNLMVNGSDVRPGFINIDPAAAPGSGKVRAPLSDLDGIVVDAEADAILALDVIDYVPPSRADETLAHWAKKLRRGGTIAVGGLDLREVARRLHGRKMGDDEANALVYGPQRVPAECRKSSTSLPRMAAALTALGLKIETKEYDGCHYLVKAVRP